MRKSRRSNKLMALLYLDINYFKTINDTLRPGTVLTEFATRQKKSVRSVDTVARLGGDEFFMILEQIQEPADSTVIVDKILAQIRAPMLIRTHVLHIASSLSGSFFSGDDTSQEELAARADAALYEAKQAGRNRGAGPSLKRKQATLTNSVERLRDTTSRFFRPWARTSQTIPTPVTRAPRKRAIAFGERRGRPVVGWSQ